MTTDFDTVVIVNDHAAVTGGQARVAIDAACGLAQAGKRVHYFAGAGPVDRDLQAAGVEVTCLNRPGMLDNPSLLDAMTSNLWSRGVARALTSLLERCEPKRTIVHTHGWAKSLTPSIAPVIAQSGHRHIYTMHEYFLACPNGGFFDFQAGEICQRRALSRSCLATHCDARARSHKAWRATRTAALRHVARWPRALRDVICISETQRRVMAPYLRPDVRLHHVPNPIALPQAPRAEAEHSDVLLFVGRLSPEKGAVLFAKAARQAGIHARFVGDGPEAEIVCQILPEAEFTGWRDAAGVAEQMRIARALVFPSLWHECQPLVPMEALAHGLPVICGAWNAACEAIPDGAGLILQDRSPAAWANALASLARDDAAVTDMSMRAHANRNQFATSLSDHVGELCHIYGNLPS
ncbi:glycosyltransferase family 4 protein [Pontivivens ytuae]|uniref:Glycosyltransferase family 4 protein n=1 Tax=Pontivivens ytuae TaxID=2789856 RepID=A0A7S9LV87_9RHOB|nr:glycosyltransferase family 4 protein [Pontivivens ytuae]QPH55952.1 glycosyltransferase family 4 protein [Pontivivens ytuae]